MRIRLPFAPRLLPAPRVRRRAPRARGLRVGFGAITALVLLAAAGCQGHGVVGGQGTVATTAGTISVECIDRYKARIVGFQPAAGYTGQMIVEGPAGQASLLFENPNANDYRVAVHCEDSVPGFQEFEIEDTTLTD